MIRGLLLILALLLGLTAALTVGGRMSHLRLALGEGLPDWTTGLEADTGVLSGRGQINGVALRWDVAGVDLRGPVWRVAASGADWQVQGVARFLGFRIGVEAINGLIPAAQLNGAQGVLAITAGAVTFAMPGGGVLSGDLAGRARELVLGDVVPDGDITLVWAEGAWRAVSR